MAWVFLVGSQSSAEILSWLAPVESWEMTPVKIVTELDDVFFFELPFLTGAKRREFSGMIHWLTINDNPSNPSNPSIPCVKHTSKFFLDGKTHTFDCSFFPNRSIETEESGLLWSMLPKHHAMHLLVIFLPSTS